MSITLTSWIKSDIRNLHTKKKQIEDALHGSTGMIDEVSDKHKEEIFYMLCFCLCVPQSKAARAEEAIEILKSRNFYSEDIPVDDISNILKSRVRFHQCKSNRLVESKKMFLDSDFWKTLRNLYLNRNMPQALEHTRQWLIKSVNGFGLKLASHFMRNVGIKGSPELAILDVHIITGMDRRGLIPEEYFSHNEGKRKINLTNEHYHDIERKMREYANHLGASIHELDLLLWSQRTGYIGK